MDLRLWKTSPEHLGVRLRVRRLEFADRSVRATRGLVAEAL
jgi:hypothetical protein